MDPNFHALQLIAEIALGILGFSAILIGLSRKAMDSVHQIIFVFNYYHILLLGLCFVH